MSNLRTVDKTGRCEFRFSVQVIDFYFLKNGQTAWGAHRACYSAGAGVLPWGQSGRNMMLTTHLHPAQRLRMSGAVPVLPL